MELDWVGYELHPETPPSGVPLSAILPHAEAMAGYVRSFAAGFGLTDVHPPSRLPNTRRALAMAEHARDAGRLDAFRVAAFDGYWRRGRDLSSDADLRATAADAGLDPEVALAAADDPALLARVDAAGHAARAAGVTGIPTLDLGGGVRIVGCQPYAVIEGAVKRAGARRR